MEQSYTKRSGYSSPVVTLAVLTAVFGLMCVLFVDLLTPAVSAMLAVLFLSERRGKKKIFLMISSLLIAVNIITVALAALTEAFVFSATALHVVAMSLLIVYFFSRSRSKSELVLALTVTSIIFFLVSMWLTAVSYTGVFSLSSAIEFYKEFAITVKETVLLAVEEASLGLTDGTLSSIYSEESVNALFESIARILPALGILAAFIYAGIACKVFSLAVYKTTGSSRIYEWRFVLGSVFAYFYCVLFVAYVFFAGGDNAFSVVIANLFTVFMPVFAYFGFGFATALLSLRYTRGFAWSVLIVLMLLFSAIAFVVLSFLGVVFVILHNKHAASGNYPGVK